MKWADFVGGGPACCRGGRTGLKSNRLELETGMYLLLL